MSVALTLIGILGMIGSVVCVILSFLHRVAWKVTALVAGGSVLMIVLGVALAPGTGESYQKGLDQAKADINGKAAQDQHAAPAPPVPQPEKTQAKQTANANPPAPAPAVQEKPKLDAQTIFAEMQKRGLPIGQTKDFPASAKSLNFAQVVGADDTSTGMTMQAANQGDVLEKNVGVVLEIAKTPDDALKRYHDLSTAGRLAGNTEKVTRYGPVVLRVTGLLPDAEAQKYEETLNEIIFDKAPEWLGQ